MKKFLLAIAACLSVSAFYSQVSHGGQPLSWSDKTLDQDIPFIHTPAIDPAQLAMEDAITDQHKDVPYRFGVEHEVNYTFENSGRWVINDKQDFAVWQLGLECPGAIAISVRFDQFHLPEGANVFIWSADRQEFLGSFTAENNKSNNRLAAGIIHGDKIVIEYIAPMASPDWGSLAIGQVVHGYRSFLVSRFAEEASADRGPFGNGGNCENNINCPVGVDWQVEKRSVAIITEGGYGYCTGALVNNTLNDGTPYFLTANHCTSGADVGDWVFYFNHESAMCSGTSGPVSQSISGSTLKAHNAGSDFALLLLDEDPPASYNAQFAGWDASDDEDAVSAAVGIHHPSGDIKKISFEEDAPYHDFADGAQVWWIDDWEDGVTEPGSSGSPLFNQDHRIIGQLYGGASACNGSNGNGQFDYYGRFGVSWNTGTSNSTRLRNWLDPEDSGVLVLDGFPDVFEGEGIRSAAIQHAEIYPNPASGSFSIKANSTITQVEVRDIAGRVVSSFKPYAASISISSSQWVDGIYVISISAGKEIFTSRLAVQH